VSATHAQPTGPLAAAAVAPRSTAARSVFRAERRKLSSQLAIRLLALVCVLAPFVFGAILKIQSGSPTDTLYGVWVHSSGFAQSLVVLGFAGQWGFPVLAGIVAGDMFSAEDRYGTWKLVLTRSCSRRDVFLGKLLTAAAFTIGFVTLTALASLLAGLLLVGDQSLVSLSGTLLSPGRLFVLVLVSWLLNLPAALAFASLGVLFSIATRNGIMGVIGPALVALAMQLLLLVGAGVWMHMLLVGSAFNGWHALLSAHPFYGSLLIGVIVSVVWIAVCLGVSWRILRTRDFAGTPIARRAGWVTPVRVAAALAAALAVIAIAGNWGPAGITPGRLRASLIPTFNNLTLLQQRELGRPVAPGARLNIVLPSCSRRGAAARGPGEWICTLNVLIPTQGSLPPEPTVVSYDVSVNSDGCYKAQSPPAFIGQQLMRDGHGHYVVNPLYTIYGCFDTI
jgi:ABC-2 type transport system permease protein